MAKRTRRASIILLLFLLATMIQNDEEYMRSVRMVNDPPQQDLVVVSSWLAHGKTILNQSLAAIMLTMFSLSFPHNLAAIMRRYPSLLWFWLGNRKVRGKNIATIRYRLATTGSDSTPRVFGGSGIVMGTRANARCISSYPFLINSNRRISPSFGCLRDR